ncbi:MAG TPA: hypothetical protein VEH30_01560 [Terriglobales bacterium]|nr:hypothetical protein [Terriglobales bacterium]
MSYSTVQPPFSLNLRDMPKSELKRYFQWFMDVLPGRVHELARAVKATPGFERWGPDYTAASLDALGHWFAGQVETRKRTKDELEETKNRQAFPMEVPNEELTNRTFSLAMDLGMYLSQVLIKNHPSLKWEQPIGDKRFVDYGQPSLVGFGRVTLNPVGVAVTFAYGLVSKTKTGKGLREVYDYWSRRVQPAS